MDMRGNLEPLTPDAAETLTGRQMDAFIARAVTGRQVYAVRKKDLDGFEESRDWPDWKTETDPEEFEPYWMFEEKAGARPRLRAELIPHFASRIEDAWPLFLQMAGRTHWYEMTLRPDGARAALSVHLHQDGRATLAECGGETDAEKRTEAQCLAMCRAIAKVLPLLREGDADSKHE